LTYIRGSLWNLVESVWSFSLLHRNSWALPLCFEVLQAEAVWRRFGWIEHDCDSQDFVPILFSWSLYSYLIFLFFSLSPTALLIWKKLWIRVVNCPPEAVWWGRLEYDNGLPYTYLLSLLCMIFTRFYFSIFIFTFLSINLHLVEYQVFNCKRRRFVLKGRHLPSHLWDFLSRSSWP